MMDPMSRVGCLAYVGHSSRDRNSFTVTDKFSVSKMDEFEAQSKEENPTRKLMSTQ